tara:strand:+ start:1070 stop:1330 length:261 start_codon:yes stop_codon:yes gene_type:complete
MAHENKEAIMSLYPDVLDVDANGIAWISSGIEKTVDADALALKKVQLSRKNEYPDWGTQLDYIYHNGLDKWKTDIVDPVKAKYPKP